MMGIREIYVIKVIKSLLELIVRPALNAVNVKLKQPEHLELKGTNDTKVILKLMVPMDQLEPQAQQMIKMMMVKKFTDSRSSKR
jgi:hypothetical protein